MSSIESVFARLRSEKRIGLVTYVTAGDPDPERSAAVIQALDRAGADIIEIGVPFSDPLADGPTIQRASERALAVGMTLRSSLDLIAGIRGEISAPVVVFSYVNPVLAMGLENFIEHAAKVGVDGVLVLDLPIEEADEFRNVAMATGIDPIFLLSPTTTDDRIQRAATLGRGFLYVISRLGVTGERDTLATGIHAMMERIRRVTTLPIALGFGISSPEQVAEAGRWADAVVVGSGLVNTLEKVTDKADLVAEAERYVRWLKGSSYVPHELR